MIELEDQQVPEPVLIGARKGGLDVYGPGTDGDVIVVSPISLSRDMYYNNLTLTSGAQIDTNGYRIFVKDTLYLADSNSVIGRLADSSNYGTVLGGATSGVKASDTLGGDGGYNIGENFFGEAEFYNFSSAIAGYKFDMVRNELRFLMGGSGGKEGEDGEDGSPGSSPSVGSPGFPGSEGAPGNRPGFENTVGEPGGKGQPGLPGAPGNAGIGGQGGARGIRGFGGTGGGVVIISARKIIGLGVIRADGFAPTPPVDGAIGGLGISGNQGDPGSQGDSAPDFFQQSYTYVVNYAYNVTNAYSGTNNPYPFTAQNPPTPVTGANPGTPYISGYYTIINYSAPKRGYQNASYSNTYIIAGNPFPTRGGNVYYYARTNYGFNQGSFVGRTTQGPVRIRLRTTYTYIPGNPFSRTTYARAYNPLNYDTNPPTRATNPVYNYQNSYVYNDKIVNYAPEFATNSPYPFSYFVQGNYYTDFNPGNPFTNFGSTFVPQENAFQDSVFSTGGAGGEGGLGGEGAIASSGLPGSPGTPGYAGGGGVVLMITESDIPSEIEVRAAAGTGDGGFATAGTVIIIKNEEEVI